LRNNKKNRESYLFGLLETIIIGKIKIIEKKGTDTMVIFKRNSGYSQDFFCLKRAPVF